LNAGHIDLPAIMAGNVIAFASGSSSAKNEMVPIDWHEIRLIYFALREGVYYGPLWRRNACRLSQDLISLPNSDWTIFKEPDRGVYLIT
jgi:hypothetical protein